jgi:hypothetical protein
MPGGNGNGGFKIHLDSDGSPFFTRKSSVPDYKNGFPNSLKPQQMSKVEVDILDLSKPEDFVQYKNVWDSVGMQTATVFFEQAEWIEANQNWKVLIRWSVHGTMDPAEFRDARHATVKNMLNRG